MTDHKPIRLEQIDACRWKVPKDADTITRSKLINEYLDSEGVDKIDTKRAVMFADLTKKIRESRTVAV